MAFDLRLWKQLTSDSLHNLRSRMRRINSESIYAFVAVISLWPVVSATRRGDKSALTALRDLLSDVGTNNLESHIMSWNDQAGAVKLVEESTKSDLQLRIEIEMVLSALDAFSIARNGLREGDREWFSQKLEIEIGLSKLSLTTVATSTADNPESTKVIDSSVSGTVRYGAEDPADLKSIQAISENYQSSGVQIESQETVAIGGDVIGRDKFTTNTQDISVNVEGDVVRGAKFEIYPAPGTKRSLPYEKALDRYLNNVIDTHQYLRLQGIRAGGQPLSVDLERVYISLMTIEHRATVPPHTIDENAATAQLTQVGFRPQSIGETLSRYRRLVIIGDPGSGKTTLLDYLALTYARDLRIYKSLPHSEQEVFEGLVHERLNLLDTICLPMILPLRDFGYHLRSHPDEQGKDGPTILLQYLRDYFANQSINLPETFFEQSLEVGHAVVLLDGLDEVAEIQVRQRVARTIERFAARFPNARIIVTSREVGYEGPIRIGNNFGLSKVSEFSSEDIRHFVRDWTRTVETTLAGRESDDILRMADEQARQLIYAVESNPRIGALAVNPLLLTVVALVHRYRAALPERRSELYEEAVEVLLAKWDEAKGLDTDSVLTGIQGQRHLDAGDRRSLLEPLALWMHTQHRREVDLDDLRSLLLPTFHGMAGGDRFAGSKALNEFLRIIGERSGLLVERGVGVYSFAHLTFQEYLAARAVADRHDFIDFTLERLADSWWHEVILLEAGYLSTQGKRRVSELIRAIVDANPNLEPEPYYHLILASECLYDVGVARVEGDLLGIVRRRLKNEVENLIPMGCTGEQRRALTIRKIAASNALSQIDTGHFVTKFWSAPWGEPHWIKIHAGEFWLGSDIGFSDEAPMNRVSTHDYSISITPITNAQFAVYIVDSKTTPPGYWRGSQPPRGKENHPVVGVSWFQAMAYCEWLSEKIGRYVRLPTEAEWEKAARGVDDLREFPWGANWSDLMCNSTELELGDTSPVGLFRTGASPSGCLDLAGNVWEWCLSYYEKYPHSHEKVKPTDRDDKERVIRGGSFRSHKDIVRCVYRLHYSSALTADHVGFRVVVL